MLKKDRLLVGIEQGHFGTMNNALLYINTHSLKIELRTVGRDDQVQLRLDSKSQWWKPSEWAKNYRHKLELESEATMKRFDSLGILTKAPKHDIVIFDFDKLSGTTLKDIAQAITETANMQSELGLTFKVKKDNKLFYTFQTGDKLTDRFKELRSN